MAKLPKHLIKQYGISKKAWQVFRSGRSSAKTHSKVKTMGKTKKHFSSGKRVLGFNLGGLSKLAKPALSGLAVGVFHAKMPAQYNTGGIRLGIGILGTAFAPSPYNGPAELMLGMEVAMITAQKLGATGTQAVSAGVYA